MRRARPRRRPGSARRRGRCRGSTAAAAAPRPGPRRAAAPLAWARTSSKPPSSDTSHSPCVSVQWMCRLPAGSVTESRVTWWRTIRSRNSSTPSLASSGSSGVVGSGRVFGVPAMDRRLVGLAPRPDPPELGGCERVPRRTVEVDRAQHVDQGVAAVRRATAASALGVEVGVGLVRVARSRAGRRWPRNAVPSGGRHP